MAAAAAKKERESLIARIENYTRTLKFQSDFFTTNHDAAITLDGYECRLESILPLFDKYQEDFAAFYAVLEAADKPDWAQAANEFANNYFNLVSRLQEKIRARKNNLQAAAAPAQSSHHHSGASVRTPKIELPTFDGSSDQWIKFRDMFESLIHSKENITNVEKFSYLQSSIKLAPGESNVLDNFKICDGDYLAAWQAVCDRYNDKRKIIAMHCATMFDVKKMSCESASELRRIIDVFSSQLSALKQLGYVLGEHDDFGNMIVVQFVLVRLDEHTLREWKKFHTADSATWKELNDFLTAQWRSLDDVAITNLTSTGEVKAAPKPVKALVVSKPNNNKRSSGAKCHLCYDSHFLWSCPKFTSMSVDDRQKVVREKQLCLNCFSPSHQVRQCPSKFKCKTCDKPHHTLLHFDRSMSKYSENHFGGPAHQSLNVESKPFQPFSMTKKEHDGTSSSKSSAVALIASDSFLPRRRNTFLSTVMIEVEDAEGSYHIVRALLDTGSDDNLMTTSLARRLGNKCLDVSVPLTGIGEKTSIIQHQTSATISSRYGHFQRQLDFSVLPTITSNIPSQSVNISSIEIPSDCFLADPKFHVAAKIDMLLNVEVFYESLLEGKLNLKDGPKMLHTTFGWVVGGSTNTSAPASSTTLLSCFAHAPLKEDDELNAKLDTFFDAEEVEPPKRALTPEEQHCLDLFDATTYRGPDGRFVQQLPLKANIGQLGRNLSNALQMNYAQEGVRKKNEVVNKLYVDYMEDYERTGHMEEVWPKPDEFVHHLPIHGVIKMSSTSTKLRPVANASSKSETGISLNDALCVGPVVQPELFDILLRFREKPFVLMGDITKMYRQIWVHPAHRKYQHILWRANPETEAIRNFQLNTLTFGTKSAPFQATRALLELANEYEKDFPLAAALIRKAIYVDDVIAGFNSIEEGRKVRDQIRYIFASAGMKLCKWSSNVLELLAGLPQNDVEATPDDDENNIVKTLGVCCELADDQFTYKLKSPADGPLTKAQVLSDVSSVFDPIGWIGPVVLKGKLFMKKMWMNKTGWKELINEDDREEWIEHRDNLSCLNDIKIKRQCIISNPVNVEVHGFSDASIEAYGACVYIRSTDASGKVQVSLVCAKSKVAPTKQQSLARLELCGALLVAKLVKRVIGILETPINDVTFWCDSTIVLNWITMVSSKLQTFVGNRVAAIQLIAGMYTWRHINGLLNPADIISRGLSPQLLAACVLWWNGPAFLVLPKSEWPESIVTINENDPEVKQEVKKALIINRESTLFEYIEMRHSKTRTLHNVIAYLQRFAHNTRKVTDKRSGPLTIDERETAELTVIRIVQETLFPAEHAVLSTQQELRATIEIGELPNDAQIPQLSRKSTIISLRPFMDEQGIIRVGGRINACEKLTTDQKHQIILPRCRYASLVIRELHHKHLHPGPKALLSFVRERFWPLKAASTIRKVTHDCFTCYRIKPVDTQQLMAPLPPARVTMAPPFTSTALDYAGFYNVRSGITRNASTTKCYIAVFKCMCTGAIHLDLVSDLSSNAFITTFDRFISRRGLCKELYTDNATCFEGADNELKDTLKKIDSEIQEHVREQAIRWKFTTPRASHAGGIYESAVKNMKHHLKRIMVEQKHTFTFEQFYSILCKIEAILNSRPLMPMSEDPNDIQALTPGHFLVGRPLIAKPERNYLERNTNRLNVYEKLQQVQQQFWKVWYHDYLHTLQPRPVNFREESPVKLGDLVLIKESNLPPLKWMMGRIIALFPGKDKVVRNVKVKTATGEKERHVKYLCLLPVENAFC